MISKEISKDTSPNFERLPDIIKFARLDVYPGDFNQFEVNLDRELNHKA